MNELRLVREIFKRKAKELVMGAGSLREAVECIAEFVRNDILYRLDEWDTSPEDVLKKGYGMCAGKALLAGELFRSIQIQVRFKVLQVSREESLLDFIIQRLTEMISSKNYTDEVETVLSSIRSLPPQRDHIIVQVFLDREWVDLDLARDRDLEYGMRLIIVWRESEIVFSEEVPYESIDGWLEERMRRRTITSERKTFFKVVNEQIDWIRKAGRIGGEAGIQAWMDTEVKKSMEGWNIIADCPIWSGQTGKRLNELAEHSIAVLARLSELERAQLETNLVDWLYALVRHNIKRGRFWELSDVLTHRQADCLGYAHLLTFLATSFGLNAGVVEVVQDNRGRYVPHYVCLVNIADGQKRLIDPWYGSVDVHHQLTVARIKVTGGLVTKRLTMPTVESTPDVYGLGTE
jgi:hypothetical protein